MKKILLLSSLLMTLCATAQAAVTILEQAGWFESGYVTWQKVANTEYNVYVSPAGQDSWTVLDDELVREYPAYGRADALGLKAGSYQFKVVPVVNGSEVAAEAAVSSAVEVRAHDRSGFAHKLAGSTGIGAYNNDGTLKSNARVVYVWADNAKTVSLPVKDKNGKEVTYTGLQQIVYGYQKGNESGSFEDRPLCIRIIGTIKDTDMDEFGSSAEGLQIKGAKAYQKMNITIEGVGNDAAVWGFGFLIRNASMVELRNFGIYLCMDDCVSIDTKDEMIWVHNVDFFYGNTGGDADQAKGDGALDFKGDPHYCTFSYNHFFDTGKSNLGGLSESGDNYITLHHNWYDHSDSRHPRIRRMSIHIYNNYFDGNAKYGVGMTSGGSAFVENNYFRNCKNPMLISLQGTDAEGKGTFSGEPGGVIKSFGNVIVGERKCVTYQENPEAWDRWEASTRADQIPSTVKCISGGTAYNNFDTDATLMYTYTPDAAADVPAIVKGQYGAGRMQHGDFRWTFNNSVQDENYGVITELKEALKQYKSTLVGFFGGQTVSNGGATQTVDAGDGKGIAADVNDSYVPSWAGGSGGTVSAGLPDPNFCGAETEAGSQKYDYLWFNASNEAAVTALISNGLLTLSDGANFNATRELVNGDGTLKSKYTGSIQLPQGTGTATFKCVNGVSSISFQFFRTGSATGEIQVSEDGTTFTKVADYSAAKGDASASATASISGKAAYVRITNKATGSLQLTGVKIMYPDPNAADDSGDDDNDEPALSGDATAEFTINGDDVVFQGGTAAITLAHNDATTEMAVSITPAEKATVSAATGATDNGNGTYTIAVPTAGNTVSAVFTIKAENGSTKSYTITVTRDVDPASIPVETGKVTLQSDNIPEGYKIDGSASVTAYTYSSNLVSGANLFQATAAQHTVTLPANAKITKIVMYAVGDNNTANKGKITELAGQTFAVDLPSRKNGTAFATATVENAEITGQFTYTLTYKAGVKFDIYVEQNATGITSIAAGKADGTIYNINGQRVMQTKKGLYIVGGKKVVVR